MSGPSVSAGPSLTGFGWRLGRLVDNDAPVNLGRLAAATGAVVLLLVLGAAQTGYLPSDGLLAPGVAIVGFLAFSWFGTRSRATRSDGTRDPDWWRKRGPADRRLVLTVLLPAIGVWLFAGIAAIVKDAWPLGLLALGVGGLLGLVARSWARKTGWTVAQWCH